MKKLIFKITAVLIALLLLSQCAPNLNALAFTKERQPSVDAQTSKNIKANVPSHTGPIDTGSTGMHIYRASRYLVEIKTTTGAARIEHVYVDDIDKNGTLDSIWVNDYGTWRFASVLGPRYRLIANTASQALLSDYLELANNIRSKITREKADERARRAREEAQKVQEDARKWRQMKNPGSSNQWYDRHFIPKD